MPFLPKRCLLAAVVALLLPDVARADQKADDIARMVSLGAGGVSTIEARLDANIDPTIQRFAAAHPNVPPDALATLRAEIHQQAVVLFDAVIAQVRARYYADMTDDEVRAILAFYATPAGQVYLRETAAVGSLVAADFARVTPALIRIMIADFAAALKRQIPPPQAG